MSYGMSFLLAHSAGSSADHPKLEQVDLVQLTHEKSLQIKLHAFLLWASIGFLMPAAMLIIRTSSRVECSKRLKLLFYSHVILQVIAVLLATGAAILSLKNFENSFSNTHQRMGLALYALIWVLPVIGFFRPQRGEKLRSIWHTGHWLLGTGTAIIGTMNIFVGLCAYEKKTTKNIRSWTLLFAAQVVIMGFIYLLQDRWDYIKKQGVILGEEQITPSDQIMTSAGSSNQKELPSNMI